MVKLNSKYAGSHGMAPGRIMIYCTVCFVLLSFDSLRAQSGKELTLEACRSLAVQHYPLTAQKPLFKRILEMEDQNIGKAWLPHASLNAQATYQSDVTALPIKLPQVQIPELSKDQYRVTVDLRQQLYDGGATRSQQQIAEANEAVEEQQVSVQLHQLKEKVDDIYLNILFTRANIDLTESLKKDITVQLNKMAAMVKNGVALSTNLDLLQAELLKAGQQEIELVSNRNAFLQMLGILIGQPVDENTGLTMPPVEDKETTAVIRRPEIGLYEAQKTLLQRQADLIGTQNIPRLSFFAQGGYGKPGLNMLEDEFKFYYITGLQFTMPVWDWKVSRRQRSSLTAQQSLVDLQRETFLKNTGLELSRQQQDMEKYKTLVASDRELVALRTRISRNAASQLENGVITANDYLIDLNAENQALLNEKLHELQLVMASLTYQTTLGN